MSTNQELESASLFDYLRQVIPLEDLRDYASPKRIHSIDLVKGFAIIMIIIAHMAGSWLNDDWMFVFGLGFVMLDILGPSLFIFLSALSVIFSVKKKEGIVHPKIIRNQIFSRGFSILVIGMIINIGGTFMGLRRPFPYGLWGWNILVFIGFSQIFSFYALKLSKKWRAVVGLLIIFVTMPFRQYLYDFKDEDQLIWTLHFIITSPDPQMTLLPWLSICFLSTIFGEYLYEAMEQGTKEAYTVLFRIFLFWGVVFVIVGVLLGQQLYTPETLPESEYPHIRMFTVMNQNDYYQFKGIPAFLIRGTSANMLYNIGAALLIITVAFYFIDIKKHDNKFTRMLIYYGKISLSLFLIHMIFIPLFLWHFDIVLFIIVCLSYVGLLGFFMYIWNEYANGVASPEWIMIQISRIGQKTGETVKKEIRKTESMIRHFTYAIAIRKKTKLEKMEDFLEEEKRKRLKKIEKKERKKKIKAVHKQMGYDDKDD